MSISGEPAKGQHHQFTVEFLASLLKAGDNRVDIVSTSGSWFLYDRIMLETPPSVVRRPGRAGSRRPR